MSATEGKRPDWTGPPENHPLDKPRGKLARAVQQALVLNRHCEAYAGSQPIQPEARFEATSSSHLVYMLGRSPPLFLGLILGEVIHDLRSALDQLAWQLAMEHVGPDILSDRSVGRSIYFPIAGSPEAFHGNKAVKYFSDGATSRMEELQPYHHEGSSLVDPLEVLQELSNSDKHRGLTPSLGKIEFSDLKLLSSEEINIMQMSQSCRKGRSFSTLSRRSYVSQPPSMRGSASIRLDH